MSKRVCIVGNGIAALVSTKTHLEKGHSVILISKSSHFGGIFNGISLFDQHFDFGMLLLEYDALSKKDNLNIEDYCIDTIHETANFSSLITKFFNELNFQNNQITDPEMFVEDQLYPDFVITNNLSFLRHIEKKTTPNSKRNRHNLI